MNLATSQRHPAHRRRAFKTVSAAALALAAAAWFVHAARSGDLTRVKHCLTLRTADFIWTWPLGLQTALEWAGALGCCAALAWPARRAAASRWPALAALGALLAILAGLGLMGHLGTPGLLPGLWVLAIGVSGVAAWMLLRPGEGPPPAERLGDWAQRAGGSAALPWLAAAAGAAVMACSWRGVFQGHPIITDSQSQIAQARLLLGGHWRLEIPQALRDVICFPYAVAGVPSYSQYPPGYILPVAAALRLGLPAQALDLLTAALTAGLTVVLARRVAGRAAALLAALLLLGSPFFLVLSGSGMNHSLAAALLAAAALCFIPAGPLPQLRNSSIFYPQSSICNPQFIGGFCLGWVVMTRPVTGLAHALAWGLVWIALLAGALRRVRQRRFTRPDRTPAALLRQLLWAAAGAAIPAAIFLFYNSRTTGHPFVMGYQVSNPELHRLGFHGGRLAFTPAQALQRLVANVISLNFNLFGWAVGSWLALGVWFWRTRLGRGERALLLLIALQTGFYAIYQFHDLLLGPRFLYELLPAFCVLAAAGLASAARRRGPGRLGLIVALVAVLALGGFAQGRYHWSLTLGNAVARHQNLEMFLRAHEPFREPTVVVLRNEEQGEMIGRHFAPGRVWFTTRAREAAARRLPELAGWRWIEYPE